VCGDTCRDLTTLWVARLDDGAELKVTDPKEQQRDVEEEEAEDEERRVAADDEGALKGSSVGIDKRTV